jgi:hypothetical protein
VLPGSPTDFGKLIADETEKWGKVVKFRASSRNDLRAPKFHNVPRFAYRPAAVGVTG